MRNTFPVFCDCSGATAMPAVLRSRRASRTVCHRDPPGRPRRSPDPARADALVTGARQRRLAAWHEWAIPARAGRVLAHRLRLARAGARDEPAAALPDDARGHADPLHPPPRQRPGADAAAARTRLAVDVLGLPEGDRAARRSGAVRWRCARRVRHRGAIAAGLRILDTARDVRSQLLAHGGPLGGAD